MPFSSGCCRFIPRRSIWCWTASSACWPALGNPQRKLPPVIHVAGTNGKGSVCALPARHAGRRRAEGSCLHLAASGALSRTHPRRRQADLAKRRWSRCWKSASASMAGSRSPSSRSPPRRCSWPFRATPPTRWCWKSGLGGRFDATNVIADPALTRDHAGRPGSSGIPGRRPCRDRRAKRRASSKRGVPCVVGPQAEKRARSSLSRADRIGAPVFAFGQDFAAQPGARPHGLSGQGGSARSAAAETGRPPSDRKCRRSRSPRCACASAGRWAARTAAIERGLTHGGMAGALAAAACAVRWSKPRPRARRSGWTADTIRMAAPPSRRAIADLEERVERPLYLICGMLQDQGCGRLFSLPFRGLARHVVTVAIPGEAAQPRRRRALRRRARGGPRSRAGRRSGRCDAAGRGLGARARRRGQPRESSSAARSIWPAKS